jgi:hypothetical protein
MPHLRLLLLPAVAAALAACSASPDDGNATPVPAPPSVAVSAPTPTAGPPNPVDLVRKAGATSEPGSQVGVEDLAGGRFASGGYPDSTENITVYAFDTAEHDATAGQTADDYHRYICGDGFTAVLDDAYGFVAASPAVVAERLGGRLCRGAENLT